MKKKFEFTAILGWSVSRYDVFQNCKRHYYYNYYGKYDPEIPREKIDQLKSLTSIPLEVGNVVHDVFKVMLERLQRNPNPIDQNRFYQFAREMTEKYCSEKTFDEIYYKKITSLDIDEIFDKIKVCLGNFLHSERFPWLMEKALPRSGEWVIEPPGYGETRIEGLKAYCKVDFLFPIGDRLYIIDWKTGKPNREKHHRQLLGYTAWAAYHYQKKHDDICPLVSYLFPEYDETEADISQKDITGFYRQVVQETEEMYGFCSDVEKNIPKEKPLFEENKTGLCNWCNYRELCQ